MLHGEAHTAAREANIKWVGPDPIELKPGLEEWYSDFFDLSTDRQIGMAAGPIPHASILRHVDGWPWEEADTFRECMRAMDAIYLKPRKELAAFAAPQMDGEARLRAIFGDRLND